MFRQTGFSSKNFPWIVIFGLVATVSATGAAPAFGQASSTNGVARNVYITGIGLTSKLGDMALIEIAGIGGGPGKTGNPSCSTNGPGQWSFVLPLTSIVQQQMYAALVAARGLPGVSYAQTVTLVGNGLCDTYSTVETLTDIIF